MKSYTDIEQSKRLAEFLPPESADMCWEVIYASPKDDIIEYANKPIIGYIKHCLPAWTLAALLKVIPKKIKDFNVLRIDINEEDFSIWYDDVGCGVNTELPDITMECPVDACYELILKLHELNLL